MNRIVRDHYPVENLPEDLREGFASDAEVRVTVEPLIGAQRPSRSQGHFSRFKHHFQTNYADMNEVDAYVAALRSEWNERER